MSSSTFRSAKLVATYILRLLHEKNSQFCHFTRLHCSLRAPLFAVSPITASHYVPTAAGSNVTFALPNVTVTTQTDRTQDARHLSSTALQLSAECWAVRLTAVRCAHVLWVCGVHFVHFKTSNCCDAREGEYRLNYVLDPRTYVVYTLPDEGTLVPKHVAVGT